MLVAFELLFFLKMALGWSHWTWLQTCCFCNKLHAFFWCGPVFFPVCNNCGPLFLANRDFYWRAIADRSEKCLQKLRCGFHKKLETAGLLENSEAYYYGLNWVYAGKTIFRTVRARRSDEYLQRPFLPLDTPLPRRPPGRHRPRWRSLTGLTSLRASLHSLTI